MDLLLFKQFTINANNEIVLTVPVREFNLSHLKPNQRRIVIRQL